MKKILRFLFVVSFVFLIAACGKQQASEERQAEVDREVQRRLDAEHQAAQQKELDQRQADLDAREKALAAQASTTPAPAAATPAPNESPNEPPNELAEETSGGDYPVFYDQLQPYGDWLETADYGFVFQPRVAQTANWRPYTIGHWVYTDVGWTWISAEPFGWATCHYGRWLRWRGVGWVWVPGSRWAPAWVSWRSGNGYVGWAPLPPQRHGQRNLGAEEFAFVPLNEFGGPESARAVLPATNNVRIINQTTSITNENSTVLNRGPSYDEVRARSRFQIPRLRLQRSGDLRNPRPEIRGDVVAVPAPSVRPQKGARPPRVERKIGTPPPVSETTPAPTIVRQTPSPHAPVVRRTPATQMPATPPKARRKPAPASSRRTPTPAATSSADSDATATPSAPTVRENPRPRPQHPRRQQPPVARPAQQQPVASPAPSHPPDQP